MEQNLSNSLNKISRSLTMNSYTPTQGVIATSGNFNQPGNMQPNGGYNMNQHVIYSGAEYYQSQPSSVEQMHTRPPRVDDALSYLDQVRNQFADNPEVYNDFLEVMKEFKSHTIDTQGVIRRVSQLFSGHVNLITGFNTFLPPGYEVRVSGNSIRIIQPDGEVAVVSNASTSVPMEQAQLPNVHHSLLQAMSRPSNVGEAFSHQRSEIVQPPHSIIASQVGVSGPVGGANFSGMELQHSQRQVHSQQPPPLSTQHQAGSQQHNFDMCNVQQSQLPQGTNSALTMPFTIAESLPSATSNELMLISNEAKKLGFTAGDSSNGQQPLHFDQAVGYLNKVKERFANRPSIYREFLSILGNYQKISNEQVSKPSMTETEVYQAVAQLFCDEEDLMKDFKSFLPDAGLECSEKFLKIPKEESAKASETKASETSATSIERPAASKESTSKLSKKRTTENLTTSAGKKSKAITKLGYDMNVEKCLEDIPLKDFVFFERVHKALKNETVIKNFFRCLLLYNKSLVSKQELVELSTPFLAEHPDLLRQFNEILGVGVRFASPNKLHKVEHRLLPDLALQIDYSTCKRLGVSYRSMPESHEHSTCSGRTKLCKSVLNDTWVSFPSWSSESTEAVSAKKTVFEDFMYRTEDERFEVDILIEVNSAAISALEAVKKKLEAMKPEEAQNFKLDANYGCNSPTLMGRAVKKLYGEHATKVLEGLRDNPVVAVPQVLKRLREKDTEWRSVREEFNVIWRDQIDKNYLKSLDHQAISFKTNDLKFLRSKAIIQQLETFYDERQSRIDSGENVENGPHMILEYPKDISVLHDANELLIHHVKRQQNIPKKEKFMIKKLLRISLIPRLFNLNTEQMSDDEEDNESNEREKSQEVQITTRRARKLVEARISKKTQIATADAKLDNNVCYALFFGTNCWLIFIRLHHIICERLARLKRKAEELMVEYRFETQIRERQDKIYERHGKSLISHQHNAVDVRLGLRELKKPLQNPEHFYPTLLHELKNVLDGITESATFEDILRNMFGTDAYIMFTMDKLIATITRQMQNFVADESSIGAINLFQKYCTRRSRNTFRHFTVDEQYESAAEKVILKQNCYKMFFLHLEKPTLSVELVNTGANGDDEEKEEKKEERKESDNCFHLSKWSAFVEKYATADESDSNVPLSDEPFLLRNLLTRKLAADSSFDPFSWPVPAQPFYANEGLRALLSAKNLRLFYERGTSDVFIKRGAPYTAKKAHREMFERRRLRFNNWLAKHRQNAKNESEKVGGEESANTTTDAFKWFAENCRCCLYRHRDYEYITYTRYFTLPQSQQLPQQQQQSSVQTAGSQSSSATTTVTSSLSMSPAQYLG